MALVLAVKEGESIYVEDAKVTVTEIRHATRFKVRVEPPGQASFACEYEIRASESVEILPGVSASAGPGNVEFVKLVLEAPRDKIILRERLYRAGAGRHKDV